jgi:hypothetical protein
MSIAWPLLCTFEIYLHAWTTVVFPSTVWQPKPPWVWQLWGRPFAWLPYWEGLESHQVQARNPSPFRLAVEKETLHVFASPMKAMEGPSCLDHRLSALEKREEGQQHVVEALWELQPVSGRRSWLPKTLARDHLELRGVKREFPVAEYWRVVFSRVVHCYDQNREKPMVRLPSHEALALAGADVQSSSPFSRVKAAAAAENVAVEVLPSQLDPIPSAVASAIHGLPIALPQLAFHVLVAGCTFDSETSLENRAELQFHLVFQP